MHKWGLIAVSILLLLFAGLSKYEDRAFMRDFDFSVTVRVQERVDKSAHLRASAFIGNLMEGATFFASPEFTVIVTLFITGLFAYDRKKKVWNYKAAIVPIALAAIVLLEIYGKTIVHHPSPPFAMIKHPTTIFPADYINDQFSYPSGHAARGMFMAILVTLVVAAARPARKNHLIVAIGCMAVYVLLVSVSRIYLGHHWFSDVVGGWFLGIAAGFCCAAALYRKHI
ncbi:phosphatase PAP2 family protein [Candidatus Gottesmanbacteria bacterium]|nr:phosphatase PAP2 family protein [Candidatus Gottesmanbacteria bacterium]